MKGKSAVIVLITLSLIFSNVHTAAADSMKEMYDEQGNVVEKRYYRDDGSLEQAEMYDKLGHKIGIGNYGMNGKLREGVDGWAAMRWKYESGKIVGEGYYGADGRLKELKQYNELGDLVAKKYIGPAPDPNEEYNPVPPLAGETTSYYDKYGRPEGSTSITYGTGWFPDVWILNDEGDE